MPYLSKEFIHPSKLRPFSIFDGQRFTIYDEKLKVTRHDTVARYAILG
jgi:hypothetical protein